jgi:hypothetical protein
LGSPGLLEHRCADAVPCVEVAARYEAATKAHRLGDHAAAEQLAATGDRFAAAHILWEQLEREVSP